MMKLYCIVVLLFACLLIGCRENSDVRIATVRYYMEGCFGAEKYRLKVVSRENGTFALLDSAGKQKKQVRLDPARQLAFKEFIDELKSLKEGGFSTLQATYEVEYRAETIKKVDVGSDWNGFNRLLKALAIDKNK